jgi:hypothetical protein
VQPGDLLPASISSPQFDQMAFRNGKAACTLCSTGTTPGGGTTPVARRIVNAIVTVAIPADTDASGPAGDNNLDIDLGDISAGTFKNDYDIHLNGNRQTLGSSALSDVDCYPGISLAAGQVRFEKKLKVGHRVTLIDWVETP